MTLYLQSQAAGAGDLARHCLSTVHVEGGAALGHTGHPVHTRPTARGRAAPCAICAGKSRPDPRRGEAAKPLPLRAAAPPHPRIFIRINRPFRELELQGHLGLYLVNWASVYFMPSRNMSS